MPTTVSTTASAAFSDSSDSSDSVRLRRLFDDPRTVGTGRYDRFGGFNFPQGGIEVPILIVSSSTDSFGLRARLGVGKRPRFRHRLGHRDWLRSGE